MTVSSVPLVSRLEGNHPRVEKVNKTGLVREWNPGPLAPKARIMPLDQQATLGRYVAKLGHLKTTEFTYPLHIHAANQISQ